MRNTYLDLLAEYGVGNAHPGGLPLTKRILDNFSISGNTRLLDLGCGTGQTLAYIAKACPCKATGVDINEKMLLRAAQKFRLENIPVELIRADVMDLPFPSGIFDIALSESVTIFTNINTALKEYARVLKNEGILAAIEMTAEYPLNSWEMNEIKSVYGIEQVPTSDEWGSMIKQAGFLNIQSYEVKIVPTLRFTSLKMLHDFTPHLNIINRYNRRLKYRVYECIKY